MQTVREVLKDLPSGSLVDIEDGGYTLGMVYVDCEDLATYSLPDELLKREAKAVFKNGQFCLWL